MNAGRRWLKAPDNDMLYNLFGTELTTLTVSVVSFYNTDAENNNECDIYLKSHPVRRILLRLRHFICTGHWLTSFSGSLSLKVAKC